MSGSMMLAVGIGIGLVLVPVLVALFRAMTVSVEDEETVLVTRFGKLAATLSEPGLHVVTDKLLPWVETVHVSRRRDFRHYRDVHVNDARGTTVIVDLWVEARVTDPERAVFSVVDWDKALSNLVAHAATAILGTRDFRQILLDRTELGALLASEIAEETKRWGVSIDVVFIRNVSLLPDVARQVFETVAARLERAKADVEEVGRLRCAELEAETQMRVAELVAEAKGQYPAAIGRALSEVGTRPEVLAAYNELYSLSLIRPHRTVTFRGFAPGDLRAADAAMMLAPEGASHGTLGPNGLAPLPARPDGVHRAS